jgi:hypothetical protein
MMLFGKKNDLDILIKVGVRFEFACVLTGAELTAKLQRQTAAVMRRTL